MKSVAEALFEGYAAQQSRAHHAINATHPERRVRLDAIKGFYAMALPGIMASARNEWAVDMGEVRWSDIFSPIEALTWQMLRSENVVMYPQFPVGPWFVDFGNPHVRIGLECDGALYHQDLARDEARAADLRVRGWRLVRLTGAECWGEMLEGDDRERHTDTRFARRVIRALGERHEIKAAGHSPRAAA